MEIALHPGGSVEDERNSRLIPVEMITSEHRESPTLRCIRKQTNEIRPTVHMDETFMIKHTAPFGCSDDTVHGSLLFVNKGGED
jgi:hypothetical protein